MKLLSSNKDNTIQIIKALSEFAVNQNQPVEEIINEFLPYIYEAREHMNNKYHEIDKKVWRLENLINNMEAKIKHQTQKAFWQNLAILIGILGGIAGIIAFVLSIIKSTP